MSPSELADLITPPVHVVRRCRIPGCELLTEDQQSILTHWSMWGADGYPIVKRRYGWFVEGRHGIGGSPSSYKTKREASAQWNAYIDMLCDYKAGRIANPALVGL